MLFNSIAFSIFLPVVFATYWFVIANNLKLQNVFLIICSYLFYGWWDWRFLSLIALSTIVDFIAGKMIHSARDPSSRKSLLLFSIVFNLGILLLFKYFNFFADSLVQASLSLGYKLDPWLLNVILPVGISFYTFQTMSYSIDIYRKNLLPTNDFVAFAAFVSFFPQLVAGPIERASNLLPQFLKQREFTYEQGIKGT